MPSIRVEYFAIHREHAGRNAEDVTTDAGNVGALFDELSVRYQFPEVGRLKVAINDEFCEWDAPLCDGDKVVFIPPVAGG